MTQLRDIISVAKNISQSCNDSGKLKNFINVRYQEICGYHQWRWRLKNDHIHLVHPFEGSAGFELTSETDQATGTPSNRIKFEGVWTTFPGQNYVPLRKAVTDIDVFLSQYLGGYIHFHDFNKSFKITRAVEENHLIDKRKFEVDQLIPEFAFDANFTVYKNEYRLPADFDSLLRAFLIIGQGLSTRIVPLNNIQYRQSAEPGSRILYFHEPDQYYIDPDVSLPRPEIHNNTPNPRVTKVATAPATAWPDGKVMVALAYKDTLTGEVGPVSNPLEFEFDSTVANERIEVDLTNYYYSPYEILVLATEVKKSTEKFDFSCDNLYIVDTINPFQYQSTTSNYNPTPPDNAKIRLGSDDMERYAPTGRTSTIKFYPFPDDPAAGDHTEAYVVKLDYYFMPPELNEPSDELILPSDMISVLLDGVKADVASADGDTGKAQLYERQFFAKLVNAANKDMKYHQSAEMGHKMGSNYHRKERRRQEEIKIT